MRSSGASMTSSSDFKEWLCLCNKARPGQECSLMSWNVMPVKWNVVQPVWGTTYIDGKWKEKLTIMKEK